MKPYSLPKLDVRHLDALLLDDKGLLRVLPAATLQAIQPEELMVWAHNKGVYQFPTVELIDWLSERIVGVKAIEIAAGHGAIGRALGIPATDSYMQERPKVRAWYRSLGQPTITYPADVLRQDAEEAVNHHLPHTVLGAWITQKYQQGGDTGSAFGVDEEWMLGRVARYIVVGNHKTHGDKRILAREHQELSFPWLVSRSMWPEHNRIYVWEGDHD